MCGIVGIVSVKRNVGLGIIEGLKRLEYRGYDSAGIATISDNKIGRIRAEGKLINLEQKARQNPLEGQVGIGHTRWATHGKPSEENAHPHASEHVAVVHNGIIENYQELKKELEHYQIRFQSETDTEVIVHLLTHYLEHGDDEITALRKTLARLKGAFSIAIIFKKHDHLIMGARQGTPLALGYGDMEMYVASDSYALAPFTNKISFLDDGDHFILTADRITIYNRDNQEVTRKIRASAQSGALTGKGEFAHFMLKEIHEQPAVIADTLNSFINPATGAVSIPSPALEMAKANRITVIGCGTAFYAGMVGKYWFEQLARIPTELDIASEFRYREAPMTQQNGFSLFISQSGETLDTLEALRYCRRQNQNIFSVLNTIESTIERESDHVLRTLAGPEIGVASTKAFTTQLSTLACLSLALARANGHLSEEREKTLTTALRGLPELINAFLKNTSLIEKIARDISSAQDVLYLGRGLSYPIALEGALKLKELSYIHAEGYAAGEMKHGPIALIDEHVPVIVVAPYDQWFEKTISNAQEVMARGGKVLLISDERGCVQMQDATWHIEMPRVDGFVAPILYSLPVQLLAYYVALCKGTDVDQPRNLAKSVTVE